MSSDAATERLHPLGIGLLAARRARRWIGAIVPALAFAIGVGGLLPLLAALLVLVTIGAIVGVLEWRAYTFGVAEGSLVARHGIFSRETVSVPLARVQSIDVEQSPIARLLGARSLTIRMAAGSGTVRLIAVSGGAEARLRGALGEDGAEASPAEDVVRRLPASALPVMAVTSPRIGAGVGVLVAVFYRLDEVVPGSLTEKVAPRLAPASLVAALLELAAVLAFTLAASLIGTTLGWAGFRIVRDGPRLRLRRGLLRYRETVVPMDRVRAVQLREGLPHEALGLCSLKVRTAGRATQAAQSDVLFPLLARRESAGLVRTTVPELELEGIPLRRPPRRARGRALRRRALPAAIVAAPPAVLLAPYGLLVLLLVPAAALLGLARFRAAGIGLEGGRLAWRRRVLARYTLVAQARSVQWRRVRQSPLQRRRALATLEVGLPTGGVGVFARDLEEGDAARLARAL
ncbi:MAG: PH domain-containing protein [Solirubrobacteraceae bacterium]